MDVVALAAVITTGVLGILTGCIAVWTTRTTVKVAREQRVQQRLGEAYLNLLKLVEREGRWVQRRVENLEAGAYDKYDFVNAFPDAPIAEPEAGDAVTMAAIAAAFGSPSVRECLQAWRKSVDDIELERRILIWNWEQDGDPEAAIGLDKQKKLQAELKPIELSTRQALADAVAAELNEGARRRRWRPPRR